MVHSQSMRASLQVAPLTIQKTRTARGSGLDDSSSRSADTQITPPATPNTVREDCSASVEPPPVFHNFLRAFYPFHPSNIVTDSTVTLPLDEGDVVLVHSIHTNGWADGTLLASGARGWLPTNYCEAYDPEEMRSLLRALLNFWDLMRSASVNDTEPLCNREFVMGIVAGVRYLLERADCLKGKSPLVKRHDGLRRARKSLLAELLSLISTAKRLQDPQGMMAAGNQDINDIVDEMILKAFKVVIKGVRFLDILEDDRRSRVPAVSVITTMAEESCIALTPPADSAAMGSRDRVADEDPRGAENLVAHSERAPSVASDVTQSRTSSSARLSTHLPQLNTNTHRLSQNSLAQANRLSSTISHRVSLAGPSCSSRPHNLVSERLNACHDTFLSHLGSFIGRLHLQSQSRPSLGIAIKQSAASGAELILVVDVVCSHTSISIDALELARASMFDRIQDLVHTARDILENPGPDMEEEDVIVPQDNGRLLSAATGCVRATGECVAKTRWVIERIGDFEFEFENGSLGIDFGLSDMAFIQAANQKPTGAELATIAESSSSEMTAAPSTATAADSPVAPHAHSLSIDKPLPELPQMQSPVSDQPALPPLALTGEEQSLITDMDTRTAVPSVSSIRPDLPLLPKISTSSLPTADHSPVEQSAGQESEIHAYHTESMTATSSGSGCTYLSRGSESSIVSRTSTRATTPDLGQAPKTQPSLSDLSVAESSTHPEDEDLESRLLEKTHAHELVFNKEGQVTGGSLAALVERLTMHESTPDALFVTTFYLTFRLFCTPTALTEALINRFDYASEAPHIAGPVRLRTYNAFKGWLESHWRDETDREALPLIRDFAQLKLSPVLPSAGKRLLELTDKVSVVDGTLVPRLVSSMGKTGNASSQYVPAETPLPPPIISRSQANALANWKAGGSSPLILDFDPLEIARQLTMKQMGLFCSIVPDELLNSKWTKLGGAGAPNVKAMSSFTTGLSNFVADTILHFEEAKKRAQVIKQWIKVASHCSALQNYDALMAITCALTDTSIKRLKMTWDSVSAKRKEMLRSLQAMVEINQNHKALRARLHGCVPPCLPFLGMFLTDLTFVDVGNPATKTSDMGLTVINFDKHTRTAKIIGELQRFQIPYRLTELPDLQDWLTSQIERVRVQDKAGSNAQASHYRKSLLLEPRELQQQLRTPAEATSTLVSTSSAMFGWIRSNNAGQSLAA
ncbi:hypothetical protein VTK26DRAFT_4785 [Humicola hyalothermophila]